MSERKWRHNGRDTSGNFKVKREDVDDLLTEPNGTELLRDDVRLGGAVEDVGTGARHQAERISELVERNREGMERSLGRDEEERR